MVPWKTASNLRQPSMTEHRRRKKAEYQRAYYARNREAEREKQRARKRANPEKYVAARKAEYWRDPEGARADARAYYAANRDRAAALARSYRAKNKDRHRANERRRNYGVTADQVEAMRAEQGGCCAICQRALTEANRETHVDHDHKTGRVRGLLCRRCNSGLGFFGDSVEALRAAILYLQR